MDSAEHLICSSAAVVSSAAAPTLGAALLLLAPWVIGHCPGMCGPLMMGLRLGRQGEGPGCATQAAGELACYQGGRLLLYVLYGAIAGGLGGVAGLALGGSMLVLGLVMAVLLLLLGVFRLMQWRVPAFSASVDAQQPLATRWALRAMRAFRGQPMRRAAALGASLSVMPCMVSLYALGLAAASGNMWLGAMIMALLVLLTTPVLLALVLAPLALRWRLSADWARRLAGGGMMLSGTWMLLISLAANGVLSHAHGQLGSWELMWW